MMPITLVLLPGMDGAGDLFKPFIQTIGSQYDIQTVRYAPDQAMGYQELIEFVGKQLPANAPFVLLGESFSGPISVQLAAKPNSNLMGLILCCTFVRNPQPVLSWLSPLINAIPFVKPPIGLLSYLLLGKFSTPELELELKSAVNQVAGQVMKARLNAVLNVDVTAQMAAVKVPILYLQAKYDRLVPSTASRNIRNANLKTQVVEIAGPHCLLQAVPAEAAEVVVTFINLISNNPDTAWVANA